MAVHTLYIKFSFPMFHSHVTVIPRRSKRTRTEKIFYLFFAGDIELLSNDLSQDLLSRVEVKCTRTGLHLNAKNMKYMA